MRKITSVALGLAAASALAVLGAGPAMAAPAGPPTLTAPAPASHALAPTGPTTGATGALAADDSPLPAAPSCEDLTNPAAFIELLKKVPIPGIAELVDKFAESVPIPADLMAPLAQMCGLFEGGGLPPVPSE